MLEWIKRHPWSDYEADWEKVVKPFLEEKKVTKVGRGIALHRALAALNILSAFFVCPLFSFDWILFWKLGYLEICWSRKGPKNAFLRSWLR